MKNILVPFEYIETMPHILDCALTIASKFSSRIQGVALQQRIDTFIAQEGSIIFDAHHDDSHKTKAQEFGLKFEEHINLAKTENNSLVGIDCRWLSQELKNQKYLGDISRVFDLVVVSRPYQEMQSASLSSQGTRLTCCRYQTRGALITVTHMPLVCSFESASQDARCSG